jgi:hypothetical protein
MTVSSRVRLARNARRPVPGWKVRGASARISKRQCMGLRRSFLCGVFLGRQVPECAPVTLDRFKTPKSFTLRGRKTGNECRPLNPFIQKMRCKPYRETRREANSKTGPKHSLLLLKTCKIVARRSRTCEDCGPDRAAEPSGKLSQSAG